MFRYGWCKSWNADAGGRAVLLVEYLVAMDQVVKEVNEVAEQHRVRACVLGRFAVTRQQKEETGCKKPAWVLER